MIQDLSKSKG